MILQSYMSNKYCITWS